MSHFLTCDCHDVATDGPRETTRKLPVSPHGERFATGGHDGTVTVWDSRSGAQLLTLRGPAGAHVAFSPDGSLLATAHGDGTVRLWDVATGDHLHILRGHEGFVTHPVFSPDGNRVAAGGEDSTVRIWHVAQGSEHMTSPSARMAGRSPRPPTWQVALQCGTCRPENCSSGSTGIRTPCAPSRSAPTAPATSQAAGTARRGCGMRRQGSSNPNSGWPTTSLPSPSVRTGMPSSLVTWHGT
jgi:WD40 repeat protein